MQHPAAEIVRDAAGTLNAALIPDAASGGGRRDLDEFPAEALTSAMTLLAEAQNFLNVGVGGGTTAVAEAMARIREASNAIESTRGFVRWMPLEVVHARADALRLLDHLTGRW